MSSLVPATAAGGAAYAPLERGESVVYSKEAYGEGGAATAAYYDPQRSGAARFQARQQQAVGAGGAGGYGYATAGKAGMSKRKKGVIAAAVALVVVAIVVGVAVGVTMGRKSSRSTVSSNAAANGGTSSGGSTSGGGSDNTTAASSYANDARLHQSFWGIAYTPQSALLPWSVHLHLAAPCRP